MVWGFSFLQYCWEDELIFYYEKCQTDPGYECFEKCKNPESAPDAFNATSFLSSPFYLDCVSKAWYFHTIIILLDGGGGPNLELLLSKNIGKNVEIKLKVRPSTNHVHARLHRIQHNFCIDEFNICMLWNCFWTNFKIVWHVCSSINHVHVLYHWSRVSHFLSRLISNFVSRNKITIKFHGLNRSDYDS